MYVVILHAKVRKRFDMCKRISCLCVFSFPKVWKYKKFSVPLRSNYINLETKKTMIVHVASFLESVGGSIDKDHYLRPIPGRAGYAAYCQKPDYTKKQRKDTLHHD